MEPFLIMLWSVGTSESQSSGPSFASVISARHAAITLRLTASVRNRKIKCYFYFGPSDRFCFRFRFRTDRSTLALQDCSRSELRPANNLNPSSVPIEFGAVLSDRISHKVLLSSEKLLQHQRKTQVTSA